MGLTFKGKAPTQRGGSPEPENPPPPRRVAQHTRGSRPRPEAGGPQCRTPREAEEDGAEGVSGFGDRRDRNDLGKNSFRGMDGARVVFQSVRDERVLG